ncbi:MAG TPA: NADP-specific glutamate dehydrogenase [Clostridiales bacterium]|nr:NADP-specific glutamate dehydrogenase [Faecalibacterium sp.]CCY03874.1 glutamate dehydrogenase [Faecalibacterium sp. CAG:1138]HCE34112.1 NADP-specific glutamate dehydrogenase [Clostridiales bacterium]
MSYISEVIEATAAKNPGQEEFMQTVKEVLESIAPAVEAKEALYRKYCILERMVEPDRQIIFRVPWVDDKGVTHVNRGFRVQFNNAIGPYKGGLRFHPSVNLSIMKFLGFEQTFKNSLTSLPMGGAKGGSDFDPSGKSDDEVMRFCQSFMTELYRHVGPDMDVPAGDIGVGGREIGYLFGQYKKIKGSYENGVLTGKGFSYGGSLIRPEATGFGATYFLQEVLAHEGQSIEGKTFAISGFGNVAWGACKKISQLGGKVLTISGPDGYIYDPDGVSGEKVDYMLEMRASGRNRAQDYADKFGVQFVAGKKPWGNVKADIYMPCATQNEIRLEDAKKMVELGVGILNEVANMPTTNEAIKYLQENGVLVCPSKAVNAGGVATSGLEMSQNSERLSWSAEEVDAKLHGIMKNIHKQILDACNEYGIGYNLVAGANLAGFKKVADAMIAQGIY